MPVYTVQDINSAFGPMDRIPWHRASEERFTDYRQAKRRAAELSASHSFDHGHAWNGHTRLILAEDSEPATLTFQCACTGDIHTGYCPQGRTAEVKATWEPGKPPPFCPAPPGWASDYQCGPCSKYEREEGNALFDAWEQERQEQAAPAAEVD